MIKFIIFRNFYLDHLPTGEVLELKELPRNNEYNRPVIEIINFVLRRYNQIQQLDAEQNLLKIVFPTDFMLNFH